MSTDYRLRTPTLADVDAMWKLRTDALFAIDTYPIESIQLWANTPVSPTFASAFDEIATIVCVEGSTVLGWGFANIPFGTIAAMFVDPVAQRRGIGRLMYEHFESLARSEGIKTMTLSSSLNAVPFYEALGFTRTRDTVFSHPSGAELPSVLMSKKLT